MAVWEEVLLEDNKEFVPRENGVLSANTKAVKVKTKTKAARFDLMCVMKMAHATVTFMGFVSITGI